jgi:hypothetical protein
VHGHFVARFFADALTQVDLLPKRHRVFGSLCILIRLPRRVADETAQSPRLWASSGDQRGTYAVEERLRTVVQYAARQPDVDPAEFWQATALSYSNG